MNLKQKMDFISEGEFWKEIKRTVRGEPVENDQIIAITEQITKNLLSDKGSVLDLGCGNGALSWILSDFTDYLYGVDIDDTFIKRAKENFSSEKLNFEQGDANEFLKRTSNNDIFDKVLIYGCFSYFPNGMETIQLITERFEKVNKIFIGNLPDLDRVEKFYYQDIPKLDVLRDPKSLIGIWRKQEEYQEMAEKLGWKATVLYMPESFYAAHYRYDILFERIKG